ncbi:hypothetical protein ACMDCR_09065 [Labrys okinawensis]
MRDVEETVAFYEQHFGFRAVQFSRDRRHPRLLFPRR